MAGHLVRQYRRDLPTRSRLDVSRWKRPDTGAKSVPHRAPPGRRSILARGRARYPPRADLRFDFAYIHIFGGTAPINGLSQTGDVLTGGYTDHIDIVSVCAIL